MKLLAKKLFLLLLPIVLFSAAVLSATSGSEKFKEGVYNRELEAKIRAFVDEDTRIIIAGDSRAERQLVPALVEKRTGLKAANIATASCDLITLYNALKRNGLLGERYVLIVSAGFFQANDGATDRGYISTACTVNMSLAERLKVHKKALRRLVFDMAKVAFGGKKEKPAILAGPQLREGGFLGVEGTMKRPPDILIDPERTNHPWYKDVSLNGARWRILRETLNKLDLSGCRVVLYQSPVSPAWYAYTKNTFIDLSELEYGKMLEREVAGRRNVVFLDYYGEPPPALGDDKYYDIQHLNRIGAEEFTNMVIDRIGGDVLSRTRRD